MESVKLEVDAVAPFASVTVTDTVDDPVAVGVPEIVPVEVLRLNPLTRVPVNAYARDVRPPEPATAKENALWAVPVRPVVGVAIESALAMVSATAVEVTDLEIPPATAFVMVTL